MQRVLLLILFASVIIIGLLPNETCGKNSYVSDWYLPFTEFFTDISTPSATTTKTDVQLATNAEHKAMDVPTIAPVSSIPMPPRVPIASLDSIESHLVDKMPCSKSCCGAQWPVTHMQQSGDTAEMSNDYVPNDMTCGNADSGSGCVCMSSKTSKFIASRGMNA
jgi:hypothetical protein